MKYDCYFENGGKLEIYFQYIGYDIVEKIDDEYFYYSKGNRNISECTKMTKNELESLINLLVDAGGHIYPT